MRAPAGVLDELNAQLGNPASRLYSHPAHLAWNLNFAQEFDAGVEIVLSEF